MKSLWKRNAENQQLHDEEVNLRSEIAHERRCREGGMKFVAERLTALEARVADTEEGIEALNNCASLDESERQRGFFQMLKWKLKHDSRDR
ncbi:MAG: hypothetical protein KDE31_29150 [Caldilineaceae bacterium]|nr:hypothetical protein [Caldilineaceae bacterium]MCB1225864.1 hypothetical protein [Verrucomicrobiales bacterium]